jgi:hypothetical protein
VRKGEQIALGAFVSEVQDRLRRCGATADLAPAEGRAIRQQFRLDRNAAAAVSAVLQLREARAPLTFRSYIRARARRVRRPSLAGDFVRDARAVLEVRPADPDGHLALPDAKRWSDLAVYLYLAGACPEAVTAARTVWRGYVLARKAASWRSA